MLEFLYALGAALIGGAASWGATRAVIGGLIRDVHYLQKWKEDHERWANARLMENIESRTEHRLRLTNLEAQFERLEKRSA